MKAEAEDAVAKKEHIRNFVKRLSGLFYIG